MVVTNPLHKSGRSFLKCRGGKPPAGFEPATYRSLVRLLYTTELQEQLDALKRMQWHTCTVPAESNGAMPCQCGIDFTTDGMPRERIVQLAMRCDANSRTYNDDHPCREPRRLTLFRIGNNEGEFNYTLAYYKATGMHQATDTYINNLHPRVPRLYRVSRINWRFCLLLGDTSYRGVTRSVSRDLSTSRSFCSIPSRVSEPIFLR